MPRITDSGQLIAHDEMITEFGYKGHKIYLQCAWFHTCEYRYVVDNLYSKETYDTLEKAMQKIEEIIIDERVSVPGIEKLKCPIHGTTMHEHTINKKLKELEAWVCKRCNEEYNWSYIRRKQ